MDQAKQTAEEKFKDGLTDVLALAGKLAPLCQTTEELLGVCELALMNNGQLRMLMALAGAKQGR